MVNQIKQTSINTIRTLSIDAIEKANSGHPGLPMGAAPMAYTLWTEFMDHNPKNSSWVNRDRFVLSAGHGSMLLYSLLHLSGYDVTLDDLKNFRQLGSNTPGHPEVTDTDGVEATTGPLGQGIAMTVGMAMAEAHLAAKYNREGFNIVDHYSYALVGDGDLMEGISHEAASLAGHLGLGKLIVLYDSNDISLDGDLDKSFSEQVQKRFEAYNWQVIRVEDGNDVDEIANAIKEAKANKDQPTLIEVKTVIGFGSPNKAGSNTSHGAPLGKDEVLLTKQTYKWEHEEFFVPEEVYADFEEKVIKNGLDQEEKWNKLFAEYKEAYPELAQEFETAQKGELPDGWDKDLPVFTPGEDTLATRASSGKVLNAIAKSVPNLFGGSADLAGSNNTRMEEDEDFDKTNYAGRNIWFGVREFAMAAALNGMALHGGLKVYGGTFFVFSDYLRPAVRLSAIQKLPVTYVLTHDSIAVGEDGPTHEPIEQLAAFRAMPGITVLRPADGNETQAAWRIAMESKDRPTLLVLTRQGLPTLEGSNYEGVKKGGYVVSPSEKEEADGILIAAGSEVQLAVRAQAELKAKGHDVSVVSLPAWDLFEAQDQAYKDSVLPKHINNRLAIEMGSSLGWDRYAGDEGDILAIDRFGASGEGNQVMAKFGFTVENVVERYLAVANK
ncbi:transketolase [Amphibacillus xylanus]|uniref:Transketolase n=1 Tax=Amphibacillus xylanus (strain ATCC 51415 / DSM 6626 / JCM 7361 / LMG 17667 / NBRC 15112 / Ep01) TaxID=698758 RepID=K0J4A9_AMPXN|nr:transketolase [Amphibacillus xylanus]BAM47496.1 transketolase [Amphibacillus xylanus NBRC 15112]